MAYTRAAVLAIAPVAFSCNPTSEERDVYRAIPVNESGPVVVDGLVDDIPPAVFDLAHQQLRDVAAGLIM